MNRGIAEEIEELLRNRYVVALRNRLRAKFPDMDTEIDEVIGRAIERLVQRPEDKPVEDVRWFMYTVATNELKKLATRRKRFTDRRAAESDGGKDDREDDPDAWGETTPSAEDEALMEEAYTTIKGIVEAWDNAHVRTVTLLVLESAYYGEPLALSDAAREAGEILGEEISVTSIGKWKQRGFKRLRDEIVAMERRSPGSITG